jgi:hypothetical protein
MDTALEPHAKSENIAASFLPRFTGEVARTRDLARV